MNIHGLMTKVRSLRCKFGLCPSYMTADYGRVCQQCGRYLDCPDEQAAKIRVL